MGYFKGSFRVYPLAADGSDPPPLYLSTVPNNATVAYCVRWVTSRDVIKLPEGLIAKMFDVI